MFVASSSTPGQHRSPSIAEQIVAALLLTDAEADGRLIRAFTVPIRTTSGSPTRPEPLHPVHRHDVRARSEEARAASLSR